MLVVLLLVLCFVAALWTSADAFHLPVSPSWMRRQLSQLNMAMDLKTMQMPVQQDVSMYKKLMEQSIDPSKIVRWYIASIDQGTATLEVVIEEDGVGKSKGPVVGP